MVIVGEEALKTSPTYTLSSQLLPDYVQLALSRIARSSDFPRTRDEATGSADIPPQPLQVSTRVLVREGGEEGRCTSMSAYYTMCLFLQDNGYKCWKSCWKCCHEAISYVMVILLTVILPLIGLMGFVLGISFLINFLGI